MVLHALGATMHLGVLLAPAVLLGGPGVVREPAVLAFCVLATAFYAAEVRGQGRRVRWPVRTSGPTGLNEGMGAAILLCFWIGLVARGDFGGPGWIGLVGIGCMTGGIALRFAAIRALGPWFFDEVRWAPGQPRIQHGAYRWMRHPSEIGNLAIVFGASALLHSTLAMVWAAAVVLPLVVWRMSLEDRMLEATRLE